MLGSILVGNTMGGVNWPGSSFNPETGIFYTQANNSVGLGRRASRASTSTRSSPRRTRRITSRSGKRRASVSPVSRRPRPADIARATQPAGGGGGGGRGGNPLTDGLGGLPIIKPPYGVITAIDMNTGTIKWQVPHGDTPDAVRNSPLLKGMNIPKTGQTGIVGVVLTKSLVIVGDPQVTAPPDRPRGAMLRAYDQQTGKEVGAVWMPAAQSGNPMTYMLDGRQYIIVAVGGGIYTSEYIAFALPQSESRSTTHEAVTR